MEKQTYLPIEPGQAGQRIQDLLRNKKMSQTKLADALEISPATMSRYVKGETDIPHTVLLKLARYFKVSTDFLLGLTDIPYTTNFDIDKLGLTEDAARSLLERKVNLDAVNWLLTQKNFIELTQQIADFREGTEVVALASVNRMYGVLIRALQKQSRLHPEDKNAAALVQRDLKESVTEPTVPSTALMRTSFEAIIDDLVRDAVKYSGESQKLTGNIMRELIANLEAQPGSFDLKRITIEQIADAVSDIVIESGVPEEQQETLREQIFSVFRCCVKDIGKASRK